MAKLASPKMTPDFYSLVFSAVSDGLRDAYAAVLKRIRIEQMR